jgi:hypothetical protein
MICKLLPFSYLIHTCAMFARFALAFIDVEFALFSHPPMETFAFVAVFSARTFTMRQARIVRTIVPLFTMLA